MKTKHEIYYDKEKTKPVTDYKVDEYGYAIIDTGVFYVFGKTYVCAFGDSTIFAYDNSRVSAYRNSGVLAYDKSEVWANEISWVHAYDNAAVWPMTIQKLIRITIHRL